MLTQLAGSSHAGRFLIAQVMGRTAGKGNREGLQSEGRGNCQMGGAEYAF